jgi:diketogulonate reductase-like aldo/keto reductase
MTRRVPTVALPSGARVPQLGQGTWRMGEDRTRRKAEVGALRAGLELGMTLIDTAEMYADGKAEPLVAEAIEGRRDDVFLVSKVLPSHATTRGVQTACNNSLKRLRTDRIDLYLLHWREDVPLAETIDGLAKLVDGGLIRSWGVSNFDVADLEELESLGAGVGDTNQVLYNLTRRGVEYDLLPWCRERKLSIMAYSPVEQGALTSGAVLQRIADRHGATPAQVALAWVMRREDVIAIPKAGTEAHARENFEALGLRLTTEDLRDLGQEYPPPKRKRPLEVL